MRFDRNSFALIIMVLLFASTVGCRGYGDIRAGQKGSVLNPVRCERPEGERAYLKRLRDDRGQKVEYEYLDAVLGPAGDVLDMFLLQNPAFENDRRGPLSILADLFRDEPEVPRYFRIYMNMYHPGVFETETIPGFRLNPLEDPHR